MASMSMWIDVLMFSVVSTIWSVGRASVGSCVYCRATWCCAIANLPTSWGRLGSVDWLGESARENQFLPQPNFSAISTCCLCGRGSSSAQGEIISVLWLHAVIVGVARRLHKVRQLVFCVFMGVACFRPGWEWITLLTLCLWAWLVFWQVTCLSDWLFIKLSWAWR